MRSVRWIAVVMAVCALAANAAAQGDFEVAAAGSGGSSTFGRVCFNDKKNTTGIDMKLASTTGNNATGAAGTQTACFTISKGGACNPDVACCKATPTPSEVKLFIDTACRTRTKMQWTLDGNAVSASEVTKGVQVDLGAWPTGATTRNLCVTLSASTASTRASFGRAKTCTSLWKLCNRGTDPKLVQCNFSLLTDTVAGGSTCCQNGATPTSV